MKYVGDNNFGTSLNAEFVSDHFVRIILLYWDTNVTFAFLKNHIVFVELFPYARPSCPPLDPELPLLHQAMIKSTQVAFSKFLSVSISSILP